MAVEYTWNWAGTVYFTGLAILALDSDMLDLSAAGRALRMVAYEQLEASPESCVATATYLWRDGTTTLTQVALDEEPLVDQAG